MKFHATTLAGAHTLDIDRLEDSRGFFARVLPGGHLLLTRMSVEAVETAA